VWQHLSLAPQLHGFGFRYWFVLQHLRQPPVGRQWQQLHCCSSWRLRSQLNGRLLSLLVTVQMVLCSILSHTICHSCIAALVW
jgi:hypothetical protein